MKRTLQVMKLVKALESSHVASIIFTPTDTQSESGQLHQQICDAKMSDTVIHMPPMHDSFTPIVYLVVLQLFTYWLSMEHKTDPGKLIYMLQWR
jgi:glucosamine 6-phosphate synthetase-like amidotransferase/phosphosugar isomerase protein